MLLFLLFDKYRLNHIQILILSWCKLTKKKLLKADCNLALANLSNILFLLKKKNIFLFNVSHGFTFSSFFFLKKKTGLASTRGQHVPSLEDNNMIKKN